MKYDFNIVVSVIITNNKGQVLIAKRSDNEDIYPGLWGIPGGKVDSTDVNIQSALAREVYEEVGVTIGNPVLYQNNIKAGKKNKVYMVFVAQYDGGTPEAKEEVSDVAWVLPRDLSKEKMTPYTYELILEALG